MALLFWLRNDGIAIAARMPMIRITTRSSMRVKPPSSEERWRSRYNILILLGSGYRAPALGSRLKRRCVPLARAAGFATHPYGRFALAPRHWLCQPVHRPIGVQALVLDDSGHMVHPPSRPPVGVRLSSGWLLDTWSTQPPGRPQCGEPAPAGDPGPAGASLRRRVAGSVVGRVARARRSPRPSPPPRRAIVPGHPPRGGAPRPPPHQGQVTVLGVPPRFEITRPLPRQGIHSRGPWDASA